MISTDRQEQAGTLTIQRTPDTRHSGDWWKSCGGVMASETNLLGTAMFLSVEAVETLKNGE